MKRQSQALFTIASALSLAACNSGGASSTAVPGSITHAASKNHTTVTPFSIPFVSDRKSQLHGRDPLSLGGVPRTSNMTSGTQATPAPSSRTTLSLGGIPMSASVGLMDAPANLGSGGQINLGVMSADADASGTLYNVASFATPNVVNVLNFQSSAYLLGTNDIPQVSYTGVRMTIDVASSSVVSNGVTYPMVFGTYDPASGSFQPSSATSQTIELSLPFQASGSTQLVVDFNAVESININGNVAEVSPTIAGALSDQETAITGTVVNGQTTSPVSSAVVAAVDAAGRTVATTQTSSSGWFQLHNVAPGSYSITVYNTFMNAAGATITSQGASSSQASISGPSVSVGAGQNVTVSSAISD